MIKKKGATGDFFFFSKMDNIFLPNKNKCEKKEKKLRLPDWPQLRPPAGPETDLFLRWPEGPLSSNPS